MKAIALLLLLAMPASSWAQAATSPAYPQAQPEDAPLQTSLVPVEAPPMVELTPAQPIYQRWYFWTGIGVTVTAIVIASLVAANNNKTPVGESQICSGRCDGCIGLSCSK